ncbi:polyprenyl synthetase family protein [Streptomyces sp. ISL-100]|uniref:polyprenyl synthetase family protein n=1 Tax=Streptomyces sp. ISL-100 TaxID=2819173 RepID=UPI001BE68B10|nr:polyprenyl synthetase family protein [Streptomyces sp. ISL-100]MBT2399244.1 polyprenyl synthetase family protein [Streptomyces sp. ISL-100]
MRGETVQNKPVTVPEHLMSLGMESDPDHPDDTAGMEWWYINFHVETVEGRQFSGFAAFFRIGAAGADGEVDHSHALTAGWCDPHSGRYQQLTQLDGANLALIREVLRNDRVYDPKLREALEAMASSDRPPLPDLPLEGPVRLGTDPFAVCYGADAEFRRDDEGTYRLRLHHPAEPYTMNLVFEPLRPAAWQGGSGTVSGIADEDEAMRYYSVTRLAVAGEVTIAGTRHQVAHGTAWYDHEWGLAPQRAESGFPAEEAAWDWCGLHLDNGWDISASTWSKVNVADGKSEVRDRTSLVVSPDGTARTIDDYALERGPVWTSLQTFNEYPLSWTLTAPSLGLDLTLQAAFARQEVRTVTVHRGFWEGRVSVSGRLDGAAVHGTGFVEVKPAQAIARMDQLMTPIGAETRRVISEFYPSTPSPQASLGFLGPGTEDLLSAVSHSAVHERLARPVLHLVEAAGKNWRSFAFTAVLEALGADSDPYRPLMAVVELLHTGSLIVDDVQDDAVLRRGRPAAHSVFGTATAINAGTAAYFAFDRVLRGLDLRPEVRLHAYELFCGVLRSAHAGQALDIHGHTRAMDEAVAAGSGRRIGDRVLAVHRLKTALPVRALADLAATLADAHPAQHRAVCDYFEALGLVYQISDDVFDLRGHVNSDGEPLKEAGEDIRNGKVTYPLACAVELLPNGRAQELWRRVSARPWQPEEVAACISLLEHSGGVDLALERARALIDRKWDALEPLLPNYPIKAMLRALGLFAAYRDAQLNG